MGDKFKYRKLDAIRVILAIVQNGTDLCFHMQGSNREIMFNIILLLKKAFVFASTKTIYLSKEKHYMN